MPILHGVKFEQPSPLSREAIAREIASNDTARIATAIIAAALHDNDRFYVESLIVELLRHPDPWVRGVSAMAAGHVARSHRALSMDRIVPMISELLADPRTRGNAQDALDDVTMFVTASDSPH